MAGGAINSLANQDVHCRVDANSDPFAITWPWGGGIYAQSIRMQISDWQDGVLAPLVVRCFPGHQETIAGTEGMIVTKRIIAPWKSADDRSLLWLLECQAEGDRLLRLEIDIDWGEPLSQRIVDGLLVAQRNPEPARGIYQQSNAESTRVFGNPYGHPDETILDDPTRAHLVYHVLVNGIVEVPLLLTVSDVGEQVAWNGFLSARDVEQIFDASSEAWSRLLRLGRLWTPDAALNRAVNAGKLAAVRQVQRLRTGWAPTSRALADVPELVAAWDAIDVSIARNLLTHVGRVAERNAGRLPGSLAAFPREEMPATTAAETVHANTAYLTALHAHLVHQGDHDWFADQLPAAALCAEVLIRLRWEAPESMATQSSHDSALAGLARAAALAHALGEAVNAERWASEVRAVDAEFDVAALSTESFSTTSWRQEYRWAMQPDAVFGAAADFRGAALASAAAWDGCGISWRDGEMWVEPTWPTNWSWWALLSLPFEGGKHISMLWDGATLHVTHPVRSHLPVEVQKRIQIHHTDEFDFDPYFELTSDSDSVDTSARRRFRLVFQANA